MKVNSNNNNKTSEKYWSKNNYFPKKCYSVMNQPTNVECCALQNKDSPNGEFYLLMKSMTMKLSKLLK